VQNVVIRIGRSRMRPAVSDGAVEGLAVGVQLFREVEQHDAVLDDQADEENQAHGRRDVQIRTRQKEQQQPRRRATAARRGG
jgi:hypothetical protein